MTTIKPTLCYRADKHGCRTLLLQIIHCRRRGAISLPYRLSPQEFDPKQGKVVPVGRSLPASSRAKEINSYIAARIQELSTIINVLEAKGEPFTPTDITATYRCRIDRRFVRTFILSLCDELGQQEKNGTAGTYRALLAVLEKYTKGKKYRFEELDTAFLTGFADFLQRISLRRNTITFYMRIFRAVYNKARRMGLAPENGNPFEGISFRIDKTRKLAVNADTLRSIAEADFKKGSILEETRDLFMFSFYARGMSFVDMAFLKRKAIKDGVIHYTRKKTGQIFSVRITPALQAIIDRYSHCAPWMLPVMKNSTLAKVLPEEMQNLDEHAPTKLLYKRYKQALTDYWYYLGIISSILKTEKRLTFNVARHSWASLARTKDIPVTIISESLGHTSEKTTNIYLNELDARKVDQANEILCRL